MISSEELFKKLKLILKPEASFYLVSIVYGVGVSLLTLAIPISVQSLVNTVTFGSLTQSLVVLSLVLLSLLVFSGVLNALQYYTIELFQRRFYARTTADIAIRLLNSDYKTLIKSNGVELVNRYFDVMTVQKSFTTLLTGGVSIILQTLVGLLLLALYHPYFLVFDFVLLLCLWGIWGIFGKKAIVTAMDESKAKYKVAGWFEEMARVNLFFKSRMRKEEAITISDQYIGEYLTERKTHFRELFWQTICLLAVYALMSSFILGLGGFLVMEGQLTLGQLVAAEIVLTVILASFAKANKYFEAFYDLYAAVDKISNFYDLPSEEHATNKTINTYEYDLKFHEVHFQSEKNDFLINYTFEKSKNYFVKSRYMSSKLVFLDLIRFLEEPVRGYISFGEVNCQQVSPLDLRDNIYVVERPVVFEGSILENLTLGNENISISEIHDALDIVDLAHIETTFDEGLNTQILPSGYPLWNSQLVRLEIARLILNRPKIIVLTEVIDQLETDRKEKILDYLSKSDSTIIFFSNNGTGNAKFDKFLYMDKDCINEFSNIEDLQQKVKI